MKLTLLEWQNEAIRTWYDNNCKGTFKVVTGAGKTIMALSAALDLNQKKNDNLYVRIVVPKIVLCRQWSKVLSNVFAISKNDIGKYYGEVKDTLDKKFVVYVVNSARYRISSDILSLLRNGKDVLLIVDECHHLSGEENRKIFDFLPILNKEEVTRFHSIGLSATPECNFFQDISSKLGPIIYNYDLANAIKDNVINSCKVVNIGINLTKDESEQYAAISRTINTLLRKLPLNISSSDNLFPWLNKESRNLNSKYYEIANTLLRKLRARTTIIVMAQERIECVYNLITQIPESKSIIVFCERIEQADILYNLLKDFRVVEYHSKLGEVQKANALRSFSDKMARILVSCKALDEGLDVKDADVGIWISGGSGERQKIQRLGRILRKDKEKDISIFYYIYARETSEEVHFVYNDAILEYDFTYQGGEYESSFFDDLVSSLVEESDESFETQELLYDNCYLNVIAMDWTLSEEELNLLIEDTTVVAKRNYYCAMKLLSRKLLECFA